MMNCVGEITFHRLEVSYINYDYVVAGSFTDVPNSY
jgi:hypothetical protein